MPDNHVGMVSHFAAKNIDDDKGRRCEPVMNEDGTMAMDIFRTGNWYHPWYGLVRVTEDDLKTMMKNFDDGIVGNVVTFNYYHDRNKHFGTPKRLRIENRIGKFSNMPFKMLVADTILTDHGLEDVKCGEIMNFSSEVDHNYIHREMLEIPLIDENTGEPVLDEEGKPRLSFVRKKYGATLLGGAVTNYPFITELNPNGLGGNRAMFEDEQGYSNPIIASPNSLYKNDSQRPIASMMFHNVDLNKPTEADSNKPSAALENSIILNNNEFEEFKNICKHPIIIGNCIYSKDDFDPKDINLSDDMFNVIYEKTNSNGKTFKVRLSPKRDKVISGSSKPSEVGMPNDKENTIINFDAESPEAKNFAQQIISQVSAQFTAQLNELKSQNGDLTAKLADYQRTANEAESRAYEAEVTMFADRACGGKLPPAAKEVIRCGLRGNGNMVIRYFKKDDAGNFAYQDMDLKSYTENLLASVEPAMQALSTRVTTTIVDGAASGAAGGRPNVVDDKSDPKNFGASVIDNEEAFVELMEAAGCGAKDKVRSRTAVKFMNRKEKENK